MENLVIVNGMAWKGVNTIKEAYALWNMGYNPHAMVEIGHTRTYTFDRIETGDDMDSVIERSGGDSVYFNMGGVSTEDCMNEVKRAGNITDPDVTNISFVQKRHECTDAQAYASLYYALTSDGVKAEVIKELDSMATRGFDRATGHPNK
jgi:hypothetical protein